MPSLNYAARRNLLKTLPFLYGATVRTFENMRTANQETAEFAEAPQPEPEVKPKIRYLRFYQTRINVKLLQDFEYLRIDNETQRIELGCDGVEFVSPRFEDADDAVNEFNTLWGLLSELIDFQPL